MTGTEYRHQDLTHREPGRGLGAPVPTCPGCGVAVLMWDAGDVHTCQPEPDSGAVPVSMCSDCYCSIANGLDSIDVPDDRRDEIAAGLVSAGPQVDIDTEDEGSFSMSRCDICDTRLGGDRLGGWIYPAYTTDPDPAPGGVGPGVAPDPTPDETRQATPGDRRHTTLGDRRHGAEKDPGQIPGAVPCLPAKSHPLRCPDLTTRRHPTRDTGRQSPGESRLAAIRCPKVQLFWPGGHPAFGGFKDLEAKVRVDTVAKRLRWAMVAVVTGPRLRIVDAEPILEGFDGADGRVDETLR